ncbi:MAG: hypothetical protein KF777_15695 [Planctomycetaceae bacterium]|nr:hypothetical protein [Planctomycetaceae bacterium]
MIRSESDIQRAHDILSALVDREILVGQDYEDIDRARQLKTVLCWVLGHRGGEDFEQTVQQIHDKALAVGYRLMSSPIAASGRG